MVWKQAIEDVGFGHTMQDCYHSNLRKIICLKSGTSIETRMHQFLAYC
jgi:hypothetical protein